MASSTGPPNLSKGVTNEKGIYIEEIKKHASGNTKKENNKKTNIKLTRKKAFD